MGQVGGFIDALPFGLALKNELAISPGARKIGHNRGNNSRCSDSLLEVLFEPPTTVSPTRRRDSR